MVRPFAFALLLLAASTAFAGKPNFVIVLADDLGYGDLSCYGNERFETPHLDAMAKDGLRFLDFHSNGPVCSPTRAALLTGRYQQRAGIPGVVKADPDANRHHGLHPDRETTFAELLKGAGYATAVYGKWHLGYDPKFNPRHHGFDDFRGYLSGNVDYHSHVDQAGFEDWWHGTRLTPEKGYSTHLITRHAVAFIERQADAGQPFCLYVAHEAPHDPLQGPDDPPQRRVGDVRNVRGRTKNDAETYGVMIREMDQGIGDIRETLRKRGLERDTLVFFMSDNGATPLGSNGKLRGHKGSVWEGGHRVPAIACWPGKIDAGVESNVTGIGMDLMPTMLELAGLGRGKNLDGVSLVPTLFGEEATMQPRTLVWEYGGGAAIRRGNWKLVAGSKGQRQPALFDLSVDVGESHDVAADNADLVTELTAALETWRRDVADGATVQPEKENAPR
jgi:arylsulfatase A